MQILTVVSVIGIGAGLLMFGYHKAVQDAGEEKASGDLATEAMRIAELARAAAEKARDTQPKASEVSEQAEHKTYENAQRITTTEGICAFV